MPLRSAARLCYLKVLVAATDCMSTISVVSARQCSVRKGYLESSMLHSHSYEHAIDDSSGTALREALASVVQHCYGTVMVCLNWTQ
eukprot:18305-Heterococcus_DN1.PRE.5